MKNKEVSSKELKKLILSCDCDYDYIYKELNYNFNVASHAILNSFLFLFRNISNISNKSTLDNLINLLNNFVKKTQNRNILKKLSEKIQIFLNDIDKTLDWNRLNEIKKYISELIDIRNKCLAKTIKRNTSVKCNFMLYLIFERRDVELLHKYMLDNMKELILNNSILSTVFINVIEKFITIDEDNYFEIKYFNQVINLFLKGKLYDKLFRGKENEILDILKSSDKNFVWDLIDRIEDDLVISDYDLAKQYSVSFTFPKDLEKFNYNEEKMADFTDNDVITIDGEEDKCLDDALSIKKNQDGTYTFYIHLSYPPSIIPYNSNTMQEALKRQETIYLEDTEIPIFEDNLSNNILSILPGKKTNVVTYVMTVEPDLTILLDSIKLVPSVIISKHKLSYDEVDNILHKGDTDCLSKKLILISQICNKLFKDNLKINSFHKLENLVRGNSNTNSAKSDKSFSHKMVEKSMVFSNYLPCILDEYYNLDLVLPYSVQPPCEDKVIDLILQNIDKIDPNDSQIRKIAKNYMLTSRYSHINIGHSGLGVSGYVRISSSARRAMDNLALYSIKDTYFDRGNGKDLDAKKYFWEKEIKYWCDYANNRISENNNFMNEYNYLLSKGKIFKKVK